MSPRILFRRTFVFVAGIVLMSSCNRTDGQPNARVEVSDPDESISLIGKLAPDVEGELLDGSKFSLKESYAKNVVLLDFWATWCGYCVEELPILMKLADEFKDKGVVLYAVDQEEDAETIRKFLQEKDWKLNVVLDTDGKHVSAYRVNGIPQLVIIGRDGNVHQVHVGFAPELEQLLRTELNAILAKP
jgi:thiol-disulfide isomerase/thioredoxin